SGDLDNIVLKALRKEPERRYASVQEFSEDLRRHLVGLPVNASPDTFAYRAQKFVQRNRAAAIAAAVVITTLLGATGLTAWQARVAGRERDRADQRFIQVRKLANSVLFDYHAEIEKLPGSTPVRERMVKDALEYLDSLSAESANDPTLQRELAAAYQKVGDVQGGPTTANLGNRTGAITSYRAALAILESVRGDQPHNNSLRLEIADVNSKLFQTLWRMGQQEEAATHLSKALSEREELFAAEPKNLPYMLALARGYRDYGSMLASKMKKDGNGAISYYQKSNQLCDAIVTLDPANLEARAIAGLGYRMLGGEFEGANDISQAMDCYQKALALTQAREKLDPKNAQIQIVLADCYSNIGRALMLAKDEPGALEKFNLAMSLMQKDFEKDPTNALLKMNISQTYNNIGNAMAQSGRFTEAIANYDQALNLREAYVKDHPSETGFQFRLGETRFDLGDMYVQMASDNRISAGKKRSLWREAKSWYLRSLDVWQTLIKEGTLPGHLATKPDETIKAIGKCDAALAGH
ncbi:MAG TPA: tetratricopeptide repeat protein, partial [Pyrinomonadaceae bacterium]|nr:tetratricopeptide repeat protein [Pyrinomonadaceae bacterium]